MLRQLCLWDPWPEVGLLQQRQKYPNLFWVNKSVKTEKGTVLDEPKAASS